MAPYNYFRIAAKAKPTTAEDLTKPLTTGAILVFDPYPWLDNGNLKIEKGEVPLQELEAHLAREGKEPVKLTPTTRNKGNALIVDAKHGDETDSVEVTLQRLKK
jgi:hypothetical protein